MKTKIINVNIKNTKGDEKNNMDNAKNIKKALGIELPISINSEAVITLITGQRATTFVKNILRVSYNESYIFITIETKNSIYQDIPIPVQPQDNFFDGQIIEKGKRVATNDGYYLDVAEIIEVSESGIKIRDVYNQEYIGAIYPIIYQQ